MRVIDSAFIDRRPVVGLQIVAIPTRRDTDLTTELTHDPVATALGTDTHVAKSALILHAPPLNDAYSRFLNTNATSSA